MPLVFHGRCCITSSQLLIFVLDTQRYALRLPLVERVVRAAAVTPLPRAPEVVLGVLDLQGEVLPVIDLRRRFRLPERAVCTSDQFLVARAGRFRVALVVDSVLELVQEQAEATASPDGIVAGTGFLEGVTRTADGLVLIHNLGTLLFPEEERLLAQALVRDEP